MLTHNVHRPMRQSIIISLLKILMWVIIIGRFHSSLLSGPIGYRCDLQLQAQFFRVLQGLYCTARRLISDSFPVWLISWLLIGHPAFGVLRETFNSYSFVLLYDILWLIHIMSDNVAWIFFTLNAVSCWGLSLLASYTHVESGEMKESLLSRSCIDETILC